MNVERVPVESIECQADNLNIEQAVATYKEYGCLVVRGLMKKWIPDLERDLNRAYQDALDNYDNATKSPEGWTTPDGTIWLPAPEGSDRERQVMVIGMTYKKSGVFFRSAFDPLVLDLAEAVLGPNVELFNAGQCLIKEPFGGHPKLLHQDGAYFEHKFEGPFGMLSYIVDTDLNNGALHVVPGSHKLGILKHTDTFSHLGLDSEEWPWESATSIEGKAGDSIFFNVKTIHGSKSNNSDKIRPVFIHRYRAANDFRTVGGTNVANRAENEKNKDKAKKDNQLGFMVRGYRDPLD